MRFEFQFGSLSSTSPVPPPQPLWQSFTLTAGNNAFGWGYAIAPIVSAPLGSIDREPYREGDLISFWEAPDDSRVIVTFAGDAVDQLAGQTFRIGGTTLGVLTEAIYSPANDWTILELDPFWMVDGQPYIVERVPA